MTLKQLEIFLALSQIQNFTKTAAYLHCAQSNVTAQIQQLETHLNVKLFERMGKKVTLTAEGAKLLPYAHEMLHLKEDIHHLYETSGVLRIGVSEILCTYLLPSILQDYNELAPNVQLQLQIVDSVNYTSLLLNNMIDVALVIDLTEKDRFIKTAAKRKESIALYASFTHPLAGKTMIHPEELAASYFLLPDANCAYRILLEKDLLSMGIRPRIALETNSAAAIKESALCNLGICLLPELCVQKELMYHSFERVNFKTSYPIYTQLLVHKDKWSSDALDVFLQTVTKHLEH